MIFARRWLWLVAILAGCSPSGTDPLVSGMVRLDGVPLAEGTVLFKPEDPTVAPQMARIDEGEFELRTRPGRYRVEIQASRQVLGKTGKYGEPVYESAIPPRYHQHSTLTANILAEETNEVEFNLEGAD